MFSELISITCNFESVSGADSKSSMFWIEEMLEVKKVLIINWE